MEFRFNMVFRDYQNWDAIEGHSEVLFLILGLITSQRYRLVLTFPTCCIRQISNTPMHSFVITISSNEELEYIIQQ